MEYEKCNLLQSQHFLLGDRSILATASFKELITVCAALGLEKRMTKTCLVFEGYINGRYSKVIMHIHSEGRDIPDSTFHRYIRDLGFINAEDFFRFLRKI